VDFNFRSPLVDFFRRGEVARDVRLLAAQGALAPRAHEQLTLLMLLIEDPDPEIRRTAAHTLDSIPTDSLSAFLARADAPLDIREFFADRGVFPSDEPAASSDEPLIDAEPAGEEKPETVDERAGTSARIALMNFPERLKLAFKGTREERAILVRDPNKMIAAAVLSSPKLTENEVEAIARMASVGEDVLRAIASNRSWTKNYSIIVGLTRNPKTPVALSLNFLARLNDREVTKVSVDRNVPEPLRVAARKRIVSSVSRG
jgi:hypothetical protein